MPFDNPAPFDTSGEVGPMPGWAKPVPTSNRFVFWSDISPFVQGYLEAALRHVFEWATHSDGKPYGFSDLAPSALEAVLRDCERCLHLDWLDYENTVSAGRLFWEERQKRDLAKHNDDFPPLTPHLSDDDKVHGLGEVIS